MYKILLFTDCLGAGGAQRQLVGLAIMLKENGYDVKVSTYYDIDFYKKQLDDANIPNELIPGADNTKKRIWAVRRYFKKERPDWVIAYQETPSLVACAAKLLGGKYKLLVSERNTTQVVGMNERVRFFLYHWADAIVPNSHSQEKYLVSNHPWMKAKIHTITNFVDLDFFKSTEHAKRGTPEIVIVASIWESKNTLGFIAAVNQLVRKGMKFHVSWYGKSDRNIEYFNRCLNLIHELGIHKYIDLKEKTQNILSVYQDADFFCLPSFYEGTPNVICEAISTGLPVACSNVCDNSFYVINNRNGILFDPTDANDIAHKLEYIISLNEDQYQTYRNESRTIAEQLLEKNIFLTKYRKILESK